MKIRLTLAASAFALTLGMSPSNAASLFPANVDSGNHWGFLNFHFQVEPAVSISSANKTTNVTLLKNAIVFTTPAGREDRAEFVTSAAGKADLMDAGPVAQPEAVIVAASVPEPATWAMFLLGFGAIGFAMRRKKAPFAA